MLRVLYRRKILTLIRKSSFEIRENLKFNLGLSLSLHEALIVLLEED